MTCDQEMLSYILSELKEIRRLLTPPVSREIHISTGISLSESQIKELIELVQAQVIREKKGET